MAVMAHDVEARAILAEREREAKAITDASKATSAARGLQAGFAVLLARLALSVVRHTARLWLS